MISDFTSTDHRAQPPVPEPTHTMQCMEVWGGNAAVDNGVVMPGLDAWVYSRPHLDSTSGGGDVHYVSSCATGRITRLLLADISGHGASVSDIGIHLRTLMRRYVNYLDQSRFVQQLNREFASIARAGGFATAVAATYWAPTSVLLTCIAGHPRPLWYRARRRQWQFLEDDRMAADQRLVNLPLGVIEPTTYEQFGVRLHTGDLVIFYTDALIEAKRARQAGDLAGAKADILGAAGLLDIVRSLDPTDPPALLRGLLSRIEAHRGGTPADDDESILMLRHNGTRPRQSTLDRWKATGRFIGMVLRRPFRKGEPVPWPEIGLTTWGGPFIDRLNERWGGKG